MAFIHSSFPSSAFYLSKTNFNNSLTSSSQSYLSPLYRLHSRHITISHPMLLSLMMCTSQPASTSASASASASSSPSSSSSSSSPSSSSCSPSTSKSSSNSPFTSAPEFTCDDYIDKENCHPDSDVSEDDDSENITLPHSNVSQVHSPEEYQQILEQSKKGLPNIVCDDISSIVCVKFFAKWCRSCKGIAPKVKQIARKMGNITFLEVDVDECRSLAKQFNVNQLPHFVLYHKGVVLEDFVCGWNQSSKLKSKLQEAEAYAVKQLQQQAKLSS